MSLWTTPVGQIDFPLLDTFLKGNPNEGVRLDFKAQVPKELAKIMAAFANTIGGIIILGVEESSLNEPVWPPDQTKLHILQDDSKNPRDQITNVANDAIYPPVNVQISRLIPNNHAPGKFLIVVRVDESKDAPHAIEKNQQVFYVEKTGISTDRFTLADMDRIERMILRRRTIEEQRERIIDEGQNRANGYVGIGDPNRWVALIPYFPSRQVCQKEVCYDTLLNFHEYLGEGTVRRIPTGAYTIRRRVHQQNQPPVVLNVTELSTSGFCLKSSECKDFAEGERLIKMESTLKLLQQSLNLWRRWSKRFDIETPQLWQVRVGFQNVSGYRMNGFGTIESAHEVITPSFSVSRLVTFDDLTAADPWEMLADLWQEVLYCFDIPPVTNLAEIIKTRYPVT